MDTGFLGGFGVGLDTDDGADGDLVAREKVDELEYSLVYCLKG